MRKAIQAKMPTTICFVEEEGKVFIANTGNKSVDIFEKDTLMKLNSIDVDHMPDDILYDNGAVYITCMLGKHTHQSGHERKSHQKGYYAR